MIGAGLLLILCANQMLPAQAIAERTWRTSKIYRNLDNKLRWHVSLRTTGYRNMDYGKDNIQYGINNVQYGSNNIQYGTNNLQYGDHNIQYGNNNLQSGQHNIQYGSYNVQRGRHNIQYGVHHFQDGENKIQYAEENINVRSNNSNIRAQCVRNSLTKLPVAEDIFFSKELKDGYDADYFKVEKNDRTEAEDHFENVRLITLRSSSPLQYNSGDTFMIRPRNCQGVIDDLFRMFNKHGIDIKPAYRVVVEEIHDSMPVPPFLQTPLSVHRIAEQYWDLTAYSTKYTFSLLAHISEDKLEKDKCIELSSSEGQSDYLNYSGKTILEVLDDFPKTASKLTISNLFEVFPPIKPQSFSIVSSNLRSPNSLDLLVAEHAEVENSTKLQMLRKGLCPNWLAGLSKDAGVYGWINKGSYQRDLYFPNSPSVERV